MTKRESILQAEFDVPPEVLPIPEWGGDFKILPLNGKQAEEVLLLVEQARATGNFLCLRGMRGRVATWTVADMSGRLVFKSADADALTNKHQPALRRIFEAVKRMNGMADDAAEELEKNSEGTRDDNSGSDSRCPSEVEPSPNGNEACQPMNSASGLPLTK